MTVYHYIEYWGSVSDNWSVYLVTCWVSDGQLPCLREQGPLVWASRHIVYNRIQSSQLAVQRILQRYSTELSPIVAFLALLEYGPSSHPNTLFPCYYISDNIEKAPSQKHLLIQKESLLPSSCPVSSVTRIVLVYLLLLSMLSWSWMDAAKTSPKYFSP